MSSIAKPARLLTALRIYCLLLLALYLAAPLLTEDGAWGIWPLTYVHPVLRWILAGLVALTCVPGVGRRVSGVMCHVVPKRSGVEVSGARDPQPELVTDGASLYHGAQPRTRPPDRVALRDVTQSRFTFHVSRFPPGRCAVTFHVSRHSLFLLLAVLSIIPFVLFRIVHTRWGDAYVLVNGIAYSDPALRITASWQAPLTVWLHARLWQAGNALFGWADAWPVFRIGSPLAGAAFVYVLLRLANSVGRNRTEKLVIVGLMATVGTVQLFFGYAENYTLAAVGILVFLWFALETLRGQRALWQPALALAVTNGLHPSTIVLDPALLYVAWVWGKGRETDKETRRQGDKEAGRQGGSVWWSAAWQVAAPMVAVALGVVVLMQVSGHGVAAMLTTDRPGGGDARWFVPLTEVSTRWEHYTMFSWPHLRDFLNEQLLAAPVTLGALLIVGTGMLLQKPVSSSAGTAAVGLGDSGPQPKLDPRQRNRISPQLVFLALCTGLYLLFTWVWNPDYGGQRDWDLFSLAALPSTLLLARLLPRALPDRSDLAQAGLMLIAVSALHTASWIYQNTLPWEWM